MSLLDKLPKRLTRAVGKIILKTKKVSPEICIIGGVVCGTGALITVGVKTWKNKERLIQDKDSIRIFTTEFVSVKDIEKKNGSLSDKEKKKVVQNPETGESLLPVKVDTRKFSESYKNQLTARRIDFAKDIVKTYWIPFTLEVGSILLIWKGRTRLRKDLTAMTAAYAAAIDAYRRYRQRVVEQFGAEKDQELALGYKMEEVVDAETGKVEKILKANPKDNLNIYGFWCNDGFFDNQLGEWVWRNSWWAGKTKDEKRWMIKQEEDKATYELRTIGYWRLGDTMRRLGLPPKECDKFHDFGKVYKEGSENRVEFGVLETKWQLEVNKGFTDPYCSQDVCYINPNVDGYIGYINEELEKYDFRYGRHAKSDLPYKSFNREANKLISRYNEEKMEQMIFNNMSDTGRRVMSGILK